jgi:hypothetical protein
MPIAIDPQIAGVADDGSPEGLVRAKLVQGDLAAVPLRPGHYTTAGTGAGYSYAALPDNPDGSNTGVTATIGPQNSTATAGTGLQIEAWAHGRRIGIRWKSDQPSNPNGTISPADFGLMVDGVSYYVRGRDRQHQFYGQSSPQDQGLYVVEDLPEVDAGGDPAPHHIRLVFVPDPAPTATPIVTANADQIHFAVAAGSVRSGYCLAAGINNYVLAVAAGSPNDTITLLTPTSATPGQSITQGGFTRVTYIYGLLLETRFGYHLPPPRTRLEGLGASGAPAFLTATQSAFTLGSFANDFSALRGIIYTNTDSVARVVTLQHNGVTCWMATLPVASSLSFDPGSLTSGIDSSFLTHAADQAGKVAWMVILGGQ